MKKHIIFLCWLSILLIAGCSTTRTKTSEPKVAEIVYANDIRRELFSLMETDSKLVVMDWRFVALPEQRTRELINDALFKFNPVWTAESHDCDDISIELVVRLRELYRRELKDIECAAPVGLVGGALTGDLPELKIFMHGQIGYHAMCAVRCAGGKWLLVEPSTKRMVDLSSPIYEGCFEMFLGVF